MSLGSIVAVESSSSTSFPAVSQPSPSLPWAILQVLDALLWEPRGGVIVVAGSFCRERNVGRLSLASRHGVHALQQKLADGLALNLGAVQHAKSEGRLDLHAAVPSTRRQLAVGARDQSHAVHRAELTRSSWSRTETL